MQANSDTRILVNHFTQLLSRWWWLIVLTAAVMGGSSYYIRQLLPPNYTAKAIVVIGNYISELNPGEQEIQTLEALAQTYAVIAGTDTVFQGALDDLEIEDLSLNDFREMISISLLQDTAVLTVSVTSENAEETAIFANAIVEQVIQNSPTFLTDEQAEQLETTQEQVILLETRLDQIQTDLDDVDSDLTNSDDPAEISRLTARHDVLIDQIGLISTSINQSNQIILDLQRRINTLEIFEYASPPAEPDGINPIIIGIFGAMVGIIFAVAGILMLDYFDTTLTTASDVRRMLQLPVLGDVSIKDKEIPLVTDHSVNMSILEDYRAIQSRIVYSFAQKNLPIYLITSLNDSYNKSLTTVNLAYTLSQAGKRVLLVDADFHNPKIHKILNIKNEHGLTDLLKSITSNNKITTDKSPEELAKSTAMKNALQEIDGENLFVIPTHEHTRHNRNTLIMLNAISVWQTVFASMDFDVILFDSSSCLEFGDSTIIASHINLDVLLVLEARKATSDKVLLAQEKFAQVGHDIDSVILNNIQ